MPKPNVIPAVILASLLALAPAGCAAPAAGDLDGIARQAIGSLGTAPDAGDDAAGASSDAAPAAGDGDWDEATAPNYYLAAGPAALPAGMPAPGDVRIGAPDRLGRPTGATATVTAALMRAGSDRERDMPDTITGWPEHNPKVEIRFASGRVYHGYLFNKSHLLAKSLGGPDSPDNMVPGTRPQNVGDNDKTPGGMAYTETLARDWLKAHPDGAVSYSAVPKYTGDELVPRTVDVDIRTSDGSVDSHVIVYNAAKGYDIDYLHGGVR